MHDVKRVGDYAPATYSNPLAYSLLSMITNLDTCAGGYNILVSANVFIMQSIEVCCMPRHSVVRGKGTSAP